MNIPSKSIVKKNTHVAQYAGDTAIWVNTTVRMHTNKRVVNYVQKLPESELNKLIIWKKMVLIYQVYLNWN